MRNRRPFIAVFSLALASAGGCDKVSKMIQSSDNKVDNSQNAISYAPDRSDSILQTFQYPVSGVILGQGWDAVRGQATPAICVNVDELPIETSSYETEAEEIKSRYSLLRDRSLAVAASYSGFGGSASASSRTFESMKLDIDQLNFRLAFKADHSSSFAIPKGSKLPLLLSERSKAIPYSEINKKDLQLLHQYLVSTYETKGGQFALTPEALAIYKNDPQRFFKVCGFGFVSAIYRGSSLEIVFSSDARSRQDVERLAASLSAKGYGASLSSSYRANKQSTSDLSNLKVTMVQNGGYPVAPISSVDQVSALFATMEQILSQPKAIEVAVMPYSMLSIDGAPTAPRIPTALNDLAAHYIVLRDIKNQADDIYVEYQRSRLAGTASITAPRTEASNKYSPVLIDSYHPTGSGSDYLSSLSYRIGLHLTVVDVLLQSCIKDLSACSDKTWAFYVKNVYDTSIKAILQEQKDLIKAELELAKSEAAKLRNVERSPNGLPFLGFSSDLIGAGGSQVTPNRLYSVMSRIDAGGGEQAGLNSQAELLSKDWETRAANAELDLIMGHLQKGDTRSLALNLYRFLSELPVPEQFYPLNVGTKTTTSVRSRKGSKYNYEITTTTVSGQLDPIQTNIRADPKLALQRSILAYRLVPWMEYFCDASIRHSLCISIDRLESISVPEIDQNLIQASIDKGLAYYSVSTSKRKSRRGGAAGCC